MLIFRILKKFNLILSRHQKLRIVQLTALMVIGGFLETCSVSLILPFMDAVMEPEAAMEKWYAQLFCRIFGLQIPRTYLICLAIALAALYVAKNIYLIMEYNIQHRFVYGNMFALQERLLDTFIHRPYENFLHISSGDVVRVIGSDTHDAFTLLVEVLSLFTELVVTFMLAAAIFVITPVIALCTAALLLVIMLFIFAILKPILRRMGIRQQKSEAGMNKWLLQSIQGIKELKVMQKEKFFKESYSNYGKGYVRALRWYQTFSSVPRFIIEGVCMGTMFIMVAVLIGSGVELKSVIPMLTAVAMAAIRLLPSVNRISGALNRLSYYEPMLDKVIENVRVLEENLVQSDDGKQHGLSVPKLREVLNFEHITYHYPNTEEPILSDASITILRGKSVGIVGPSGSGKTTSVDIILGLLNPQDGRVLVDGVDIKNDLPGWLSQIGYIPQTIFMLDDTIRANVAFGIPEREIDDEQIWRALREAALEEFVRSLPEVLDTQIGERGLRLSGGQRQRIGIARALYQNPEVLIFDEATSALDNETESAIMESIQGLRGTKTMVIIAHRLTTIEACDHIFRVEHGQIKQER